MIFHPASVRRCSLRPGEMSHPPAIRRQGPLWRGAHIRRGGRRREEEEASSSPVLFKVLQLLLEDSFLVRLRLEVYRLLERIYRFIVFSELAVDVGHVLDDGGVVRYRFLCLHDLVKRLSVFTFVVENQ